MCAGAFSRFAPFAFNRRSAIEGLPFLELAEREQAFGAEAAAGDRAGADADSDSDADADADVGPRFDAIPSVTGGTASVVLEEAELRGDGDGELFVCIASKVSAAPVRPLALWRRCRGTTVASTMPDEIAPPLDDADICSNTRNSKCPPHREKINIMYRYVAEQSASQHEPLDDGATKNTPRRARERDCVCLCDARERHI